MSEVKTLRVTSSVLGLDGEYVRAEDYAELKAQRDALAAENAALISAFMPKEIPTEATDNFSDTAVLGIDGDEFQSWQWVDNQDEVIRGVLSFFKPETPATDAYLNSVRNELVDEAIHALAASGAQSFGDCMVALNQLRAGEPS